MLASRQGFLDEVGLGQDGQSNDYSFNVGAFQEFGV
jgi:hypothetical protein